MLCKVITNRYATETKSINLDILKLIKNPIVIPSKDQAPLFNLSFNQVIKPTKRAGFNHGGSEWLVLDFDNGLTMLEFKEKYFELFHNYYLMWTSYSSTPDKQKFRFITKLDRVYSDVEWKAMTRLLIKKFPDNDRCSFQTSRYFNCPCVADDKNYIHEYNTQDKKLNLLEYLGIDSGFLQLLVSRVSQEPEEQPETPRKTSVLDFKVLGDITLRNWLQTPLKAEGGNGGIRTRGSYSAVQLCKKYGDYETLNLVKRKCYSCGLAKWFDKQ